MNSLYKRQFALTAGMVLLTLLLLGAAFLAISYNYTIREKQKSMIKNAETMALLSANYFTSGDPVQAYNLQVLITFASTISDSDFLVCTTGGSILFGSSGNRQPQTFSGDVPSWIISEVMSKGQYSAMSTLGEVFSKNRSVVGVPVQSASTGQTLGVVFNAADTSALTGMWRAFVSIFLFTALVVLALAFASSSVASHRLTRPLKVMAEATGRFARGQFDIRVPTDGRVDEIGELAVAFNAMAESLEQVEQRRREFIANISHELKTPMTTIAGYTDGILDGTIPPDKEREYLQIISDETRRLSRLVRRMLDVSQLQSGEPLQMKERFDLSEVLRRVLVSMEHKINGRHLDVDTQLPEEPVNVLGDRDMITQVVYNLLDNAVKFAAGGTTLGLTLQKKGGKAYVSVSNRGEVIPPGELPLLFERFHKTDHSRSVDRDGVGLGLYIVKTILNRHHEDITVTSKDGLTEFTFSLTMAK
ncbi:sensor histidine kinase [Papillibacter cinnamivorans]|uniref:histidine kinase n=1 Tax=Papillibacter cinnamivorans DSM 12816 TaxID=1122930 RepID=A0A1W2AAZ8_9FIRM|nr:HAMP domain-containing sensor histidine kinase [Papillibacter cinnamivorans]SMC57824.1 Signal transduction histidine kinase [Papillibacter cinnamivorans DSM 12816]